MLSTAKACLISFRRAVLHTTIVALALLGVGGSAFAQTAQVTDDPNPAIVANFYFGGTFMTSEAWREGPWGTPSLWESLYHYGYHRNGTKNNVGIKTYHYYHAGIGAWYEGIPEIQELASLGSKAFGNIPHCNINPRGWDEVHNGSLLDGWKGGALDNWEKLLASTDPADKIVVNIFGQSRGGMSAIRFAGEITRPTDPSLPDDAWTERIAWINVIATDPVWDEHAGCLDDVIDPDYSKPEHFVLPPQVRNYIGIYAEDERAKKFHPIVPGKPSSSDTNLYLWTVPGSHQTLVGSPERDGHNPAFDNFTSTFLKWDNTPDEHWKDVYNFVTVATMRLLNSPDFGHTIFWSKAEPSPNMLYTARTSFASDNEMVNDVRAAHSSDLGEFVQTISFLPTAIFDNPLFLIIWGGALMSSGGVGQCDMNIGFWDIQFGLHERPRCGVVATGAGPDTGKVKMAGISYSPEVHDSGASIKPKDAGMVLFEANEIIARNDELTIATTVNSGGSVRYPGWTPIVGGTSRDIFVERYGELELTIEPEDAGTIIEDVMVDGDSKGPVRTLKLRNVSEDHAVEVWFKDRPGEARDASAGPGGTISPSGTVEVGYPTRFTISPLANNKVAEVWIDGDPIGPRNWLFAEPLDPPVNPECPFSPVCSYVIGQTIEAEFSIGWGLRVQVGPRDAGRVTGPGIDCTGDPASTCTAFNLDADTSIVLTAIPDPDPEIEFDSWTGCDEVLANPLECQMNLSADPPLEGDNWRHVSANFIGSDPSDEDGDSVPSTEEMNVPNYTGPGFGDGNGDGVMDHVQAYIASAQWPETGVYQTIDTSASGSGMGGVLDAVAIAAEPTGAQSDAGFAYPFGVMSFDLDQTSSLVTLTIHPHALDESSEFQFRMIHPATGNWYSLSGGCAEDPIWSCETVFTDIEKPDGTRGTVVRVEYTDESVAKSMFGGLALVDSDGDNIGDKHENDIYGTNPYQQDSDQDGLTDPEEVALGTDPTKKDTNSDTIPDKEQIDGGGDPLDPDTDGDGIPNVYEAGSCLDPLVDDADGDADGDGVSNGDEYAEGRNPCLDEDDWDKDGMPNDWEIDNGLDPAVDDGDDDPDGDGRSNREEYENGTDPLGIHPIPALGPFGLAALAVLIALLGTGILAGRRLIG